MGYKLFCDRCETEIPTAPVCETDETEISMRKPDTGNDAQVIATICNKCYVAVFVEGGPWKLASDGNKPISEETT